MGRGEGLKERKSFVIYGNSVTDLDNILNPLKRKYPEYGFEFCREKILIKDVFFGLIDTGIGSVGGIGARNYYKDKKNVKKTLPRVVLSNGKIKETEHDNPYIRGTTDAPEIQILANKYRVPFVKYGEVSGKHGESLRQGIEEILVNLNEFMK